MQFDRLNILLLLPASLLLIILSQIAPGTQQQPPQQYACNMAIAEECFSQLFDQMPICSASEEAAELAFRCVHYNVLDACFSRPIEPRIKCAPKQIGQAARMAYAKRVDFCLFSRGQNGMNIDNDNNNNHNDNNNNHYTTAGDNNSDKSGKNSGEQRHQHQQRRRHNHQGIQRTSYGASIGIFAPPTELQFISLFGYLQIQCRPPIHRKSLEAKGNNRRSQIQRDSAGGYASSSLAQGNCSASELDDISALCEDEIRQRQPPPHFVLERHKLLRLKLDASSKLLQFPETRPEDECLMVRSVLSDIYLIHQKYCFHATVTKCMCERLKFERTCGIQCANLEPFGLPLHRELLWNDFRGRLSAAPGTKSGPGGLSAALLFGTLLLLIVARRIGPQSFDFRER